MLGRTPRRLTNLPRLALSVVAFTSTFAAHAARADTPDMPSFDARRQALIAALRARSPEGPRPISERVLAAMAAVPRHELVPAELRHLAYEDTPLPIGHGQTISQPYVVALMTELADVQAGDVVLEVGTGSGYQAAVLAELGAKVRSIEIVEPLGREAERRLRALGYDDRVHVRIGDGYKGWPELAPFAAIVVTAAPPEIPPPLIEQLAPGGTLVAPVGGSSLQQQLTVLEKNTDGTVSKRTIVSVRFVPLTRTP